MKKWTVLGGVLLLAIIWFWWPFSGGSQGNIREELVLHLEDTGRVAAIKILDREGGRIHLHKKNKIWYLNDDIPARQHAVANLLKTLREQRVSALVPTAAKDNVVKDLSSNSVRVNILDRKGKDILTFYVGGVTPDERGTFMIREGSEWPVIVGVPGFEGALRSRYIMPEREWQSRKLIASISDFQEIRLDYPTNQEHSLVIRKSGEAYSVQPLHRPDTIVVPVNRYVCEAYMDLLNELQAEAVLDPSRISSLQAAMPFCQLTIIGSSGEVQELMFYPTVWIDTPEESDKTSFIERYYTLYNGEHLFLTQHQLMQKVFTGYSHFVSTSEELQ